jgi:predicted dehydrogenase
LLASWRSIAITWKIRVVGEKGEVRVSLLSGWKAEARDAQGRLIERRGKGNLLALALGAYKIYQKEYEDFAGAILTGRPPRVAVRDGVATVRVIDAVRSWRGEGVKRSPAGGSA